MIIVAFLKEYLSHTLLYDTNAKLYMEKASSYGIRINKVVHKAFLKALEQITKSSPHHSIKPCTLNQHVYLLLFLATCRIPKQTFLQRKR
jgi:hypothetical protein